MIIGFPHKPGSGGPGSFQIRFENKLIENGWQVVYHGDDIKPDLIMVIGGTKKLFWLWKMKRKGVPVLYRLDGIRWIHRKKKINFSKFIDAEIGNFLCRILHAFLADHIVYQSVFVQEWWDKKGWLRKNNFTIIYNGVDLKEFKPSKLNDETVKVVCLEGTIDYSPYAVELINQLSIKLYNEIQIDVYGGAENKESLEKLNEKVNYKGKVKREDVPTVFSNCIYLSLDVNPACPNTVIEALASGVPVVAYDTGSLKELVKSKGGKVVSFGSNPWKLGLPDVEAMADGIREVSSNYNDYSQAARKVAVDNYNIQDVFGKYLEIINGQVNK